MDGWLGFLAIFIGLVIVVVLWWFGGLSEDIPPSGPPPAQPSSYNRAVPSAPPLWQAMQTPVNNTVTGAATGHSNWSPLASTASQPVPASNSSMSDLTPFSAPQQSSPLSMISSLSRTSSVSPTLLQPWTSVYTIAITTFNTAMVGGSTNNSPSTLTIEELPDDDVKTSPDTANSTIQSSDPISEPEHDAIPIRTTSPNTNVGPEPSVPTMVDLQPQHDTSTPSSVEDLRQPKLPDLAPLPSLASAGLSSIYITPQPTAPGKIFVPDAPRVRSRHETRCNEILEEYYGRPFASIWHPDIIYKTGYLLELDCYNAELQLALEYNAIQHYHWPNFTGVSYSQFEAQQDRDAHKRKRCAEIGIYLIVVPYWVEFQHLRSYIHERLPENRVRSG